MVSASYRYFIEALLILEKENIQLPTESLSAITITSEYDMANRPIIYISFNVQSRIYDKMVLNMTTAIINLRIKKYNKSSSGSINRDYIHDNFSYIIKTDPDYHKSLKENRSSSVDEDSYMAGTIALFKKDTLDNIKHVYNDIIKNSNMSSIVHRYTRDRKMIIEPFTNTDTIDTIIIPPMESMTDLLSFLNDFQTFYDKRYRYFEDFDVTYLLNSIGNPIHGNDKYDTIIINILDTIDDRTKSVGIEMDDNSKSYILHIDALNTSMNINTVQNKEYNSIIGISSTGDIKKVHLKNINNDKTDRAMIQRIYNDNMDYIENLRHEMDSSSVILQITRTEMDGSLFTPNKEYLINNYREYKEYNGKFILSYKKEVILQQDTEFMSDMIIGLRKVME